MLYSGLAYWQGGAAYALVIACVSQMKNVRKKVVHEEWVGGESSAEEVMSRKMTRSKGVVAKVLWEVGLAIPVSMHQHLVVLAVERRLVVDVAKENVVHVQVKLHEHTQGMKIGERMNVHHPRMEGEEMEMVLVVRLAPANESLLVEKMIAGNRCLTLGVIGDRQMWFCAFGHEYFPCRRQMAQEILGRHVSRAIAFSPQGLESRQSSSVC